MALSESFCVSCLIPIASLFNPASILFGLALVYLPGGIIPLWIPSERGQGDVLLPLVGSGWYTLAMDLSKSQQLSSHLLSLVPCSLVFAHHTMSLSRNHVSSSLTSPWQHEATLVRYHGSFSQKYPVATRGHSGIKNLPLPHLLWQHEATLVSLLATRGHPLISVESRAHSPVATRGHFCYLLWNHGPTTIIWQHEAISLPASIVHA